MSNEIIEKVKRGDLKESKSAILIQVKALKKKRITIILVLQIRKRVAM